MEELRAPRRPQTRRKRRNTGRQAELLVTAMIGILALFVSAYTVYVQRQQLKIQAWPRLGTKERCDHCGRLDDPEFHYASQLVNRGLAPAQVRTMRLSYRGEDFADSISFLKRVKAAHGITQMVGNLEGQSPVNEVMAVGQELTIFETSYPKVMAMLSLAGEARVSICYCSVLDECWVYELIFAGRDSTVPVSQCPVYPTEFTNVHPERRSDNADYILAHAPAVETQVDDGGTAKDAGPDGAR